MSALLSHRSQIKEGVGLTISHFVILHFGDIDENLGRRVIQRNRLENGCPVIRHGNLSRRRRVENLVHALGTQSRFDQVAQRERSDKGRESSLVTSTQMRQLLTWAI